jgi:CheY-like chemotaxis protein
MVAALSRGRHILVVDDAPDVRLMLRYVLEDGDSVIVTAASAREALLRLAEPRPIDLVVLDVQMPEMDGWEMLTAVRANPGWRDLPVILCTAHGAPLDLVRGWELGCDAYVTKPIDVGAVRATVTTTLQRSPEERRRARASAVLAVRHDLG